MSEQLEEKKQEAKKGNVDFAATLEDGTAYASEDVAKHEITMPGGDKADVFVAELADKKFRDILGNPKGYDRAELIAAAIRKPDGKPLLTRDAAGKLKPMMAKVLEEVAMKACGFDKDAAEKSGNE